MNLVKQDPLPNELLPDWKVWLHIGNKKELLGDYMPLDTPEGLDFVVKTPESIKRAEKILEGVDWKDSKRGDVGHTLTLCSLSYILTDK